MTDKGDTPRQTWLKAVVNRHAEGNLTAFAERYDFDYTGLNLMRSGKRPISDKTVAAICSRLRIDPPEGDPVYGPQGLKVPDAPPPKAEPPAPTYDEVLTMLKTNTRLLNAALDRLDTLASLVEKLAAR